MVIFALPAVVLVLVRRIARRDSWQRRFVCRSALDSSRLGSGCSGVSGRREVRFLAPYGLYSRYYFPDDVMGFGLTGLQPLRPLNPDMALFNEYVKILHADYTLASLPTQSARAGHRDRREHVGDARDVSATRGARAVYDERSDLVRAWHRGSSRARVSVRRARAPVDRVLRGDPARTRVRDRGGWWRVASADLESRARVAAARATGGDARGVLAVFVERGSALSRTSRAW